MSGSEFFREGAENDTRGRVCSPETVRNLIFLVLRNVMERAGAGVYFVRDENWFSLFRMREEPGALSAAGPLMGQTMSFGGVLGCASASLQSGL